MLKLQEAVIFMNNTFASPKLLTTEKLKKKTTLFHLILRVINT
jgi:hypothetical protein